MGVSKNNGIPKSSIWIGFSIVNHPFWGTPIFGNTQVLFKMTRIGSVASNMQEKNAAFVAKNMVQPAESCPTNMQIYFCVLS